MNSILDEFTQSCTKKELPDLAIGDTVEVGVKIIEGDKERTQKFAGVLIAAKGRGIQRSITVRRIVAGEGVECVFPVYSPRIERIQVVRHGTTRRAKLYYLRERVGKGVRLKERREGEKAEAAGTEPKPQETAKAPETPQNAGQAEK
jgi:large subunit ribosomal protein L19